MSNEIFVINGLTEGERVRLARLAKGLRQLDIACMAKVSISEVTALEKDRYIRKNRKSQILKVLGLDEQPEVNHVR